MTRTNGDHGARERHLRLDTRGTSERHSGSQGLLDEDKSPLSESHVHANDRRQHQDGEANGTPGETANGHSNGYANGHTNGHENSDARSSRVQPGRNRTDSDTKRQKSLLSLASTEDLLGRRMKGLTGALLGGEGVLDTP